MREVTNRRTFLKRTTAASLALPSLVRASALGRDGHQPASERLTMGSIGVGGMGTNNMRAFLAQNDVQVVAVCDVVEASDQYGHWYQKGWNGPWFGREPARKIVNDTYSQQVSTGQYKGCDAYIDFREVIERDDIDLVCITTPDHWHAIPAILAAQSGKDIYCEKPMSLTVAEGRAMAQAVSRYGTVFQAGMHRRSDEASRFACELVRNGRIGEIRRAEVTIGTNNKKGPASDWKAQPIPDWLDYDMWLGPAPWAPYHKDRCLYTFRFVSDYSGGQTTNLGAHGFDLVQWALGTDDTGPVEFEDRGGQWPEDGLFDTATFVHFGARYANGVELECRTEGSSVSVRFEGTEGWVCLNMSGNKITCHPESLRTSVIGPNEIHLYQSNEHHRNLIDCIKTRQPTAAPVEVGHRTASICHLGNIAMTLKQKLAWDPVAERVTNSDEANRMLSKPMHGPWHL